MENLNLTKKKVINLELEINLTSKDILQLENFEAKIEPLVLKIDEEYLDNLLQVLSGIQNSIILSNKEEKFQKKN
jgi:hypothetical protein